MVKKIATESDFVAAIGKLGFTPARGITSAYDLLLHGTLLRVLVSDSGAMVQGHTAWLVFPAAYEAVKKAKKKVTGRQAKVSGDNHEAFLEQHHAEALRLGIVAMEIEHNEPHGKKIRGQWMMVKPGVADYTGILLDGHGGTLAVEAKSRKDDLSFTEITPKQRAHLDATARAGGKAFLAVRIDGVDAVIPWTDVPWKDGKITAADIEPWRIPRDCFCYLDKYCPERGEPVAVRRRVYQRE